MPEKNKTESTKSYSTYIADCLTKGTSSTVMYFSVPKGKEAYWNIESTENKKELLFFKKKLKSNIINHSFRVNTINYWTLIFY